MTNKQMMDLAMKTATGNTMTKQFTYDEFMDDDLVIDDYSWYPFESYSENEYINIVISEYDSILRAMRMVEGKTEIGEDIYGYKTYTADYAAERIVSEDSSLEEYSDIKFVVDGKEHDGRAIRIMIKPKEQ